MDMDKIKELMATIQTEEPLGPRWWEMSLSVLLYSIAERESARMTYEEAKGTEQEWAARDAYEQCAYLTEKLRGSMEDFALDAKFSHEVNTLEILTLQWCESLRKTKDEDHPHSTGIQSELRKHVLWMVNKYADHSVGPPGYRDNHPEPPETAKQIMHRAAPLHPPSAPVVARSQPQGKGTTWWVLFGLMMFSLAGGISAFSLLIAAHSPTCNQLLAVVFWGVMFTAFLVALILHGRHIDNRRIREAAAQREAMRRKNGQGGMKGEQ